MTNSVNYDYINFISEDKMTYSYSAIMDCRKAIKEFAWKTA